MAVSQRKVSELARVCQADCGHLISNLSLCKFLGVSNPNLQLDQVVDQGKALDPGKVMEAIGAYGQGLIDLEDTRHLSIPA